MTDQQPEVSLIIDKFHTLIDGYTISVSVTLESDQDLHDQISALYMTGPPIKDNTDQDGRRLEIAWMRAMAHHLIQGLGQLDGVTVHGVEIEQDIVLIAGGMGFWRSVEVLA